MFVICEESDLLIKRVATVKWEILLFSHKVGDIELRTVEYQLLGDCGLKYLSIYYLDTSTA